MRSIYDKISVCPKIIINSFQETISLHTYISEKSKYLNVLYPQHIYFICPKLKILKLINKENDSTSVIVERYIFIFCQIYQSNIYNYIEYIVWSIVCPNCCQRQYIIGSESLYMLDVDFCYIYLIKSEFN